MSTYSNRIKELRMGKSLSQEQLADMIGTTKQAVSNYERGVRKPDIPTIEALCDIFNVSSDYLLGKSLTVLVALEFRFLTVSLLVSLSTPSKKLLIGKKSRKIWQIQVNFSG